MNPRALLRPTSGVMPTLAPGGKTGSAANAEVRTAELAATVRATAAKYRRSFMKDLPGLHDGHSGGRRRSLVISGALGHDEGRPGRLAFSGFAVPATGRAARPFHRRVPIWRPFRGYFARDQGTF